MKKYFPILISVSIFFLLAFGQVVWDILPLSASQAKKEESERLAYEHALRFFQDKSIEGNYFNQNFYQNKIVILNFWASWCGPCLEEFPTLTELRTLFTENELDIIAINTDEESPLENIHKLSKQYNFNFDIVVDVEGYWVRKFKVDSIPLSLIYFNGKLVEMSNGAMDFASAQNVEKLKNYLTLNKQ